MHPFVLTSCMPACSCCGGTAPATMCSHCRQALYCGRACQRQDWLSHSAACSELSSASAAALAAFCTPPSSSCDLDTHGARLHLALCLTAPADACSVMLAQLALSHLLKRGALFKEALTVMRPALATARELEGCNGSTALSTSVLLGSTHALTSLKREGVALLLDSHTRFVSRGGPLCRPALGTLVSLFQCMPYLPACHYSAAASRARGALLALGVPLPPSASALDAVSLAFKEIELRAEYARVCPSLI
jgi:hypothetical protein